MPLHGNKAPSPARNSGGDSPVHTPPNQELRLNLLSEGYLREAIAQSRGKFSPIYGLCRLVISARQIFFELHVEVPRKKEPAPRPNSALSAVESQIGLLASNLVLESQSLHLLD